MTEDLGRGSDARENSQDTTAENESVPAAEVQLAQAGQAEVTLTRPGPGETDPVRAEAGQRLIVAFDPDLAQVQVVGNDLILVFPDGGRIEIKGLGTFVDDPDGPVFEIAEAVVPGGTIFAQAEALTPPGAGPVSFETAAAAAVEGTGETRYSDDTGEVIPLLDPQGVIPPVELVFGLPEFERIKKFGEEDDQPVIVSVEPVSVDEDDLEGGEGANGLSFSLQEPGSDFLGENSFVGLLGAPFDPPPSDAPPVATGNIVVDFGNDGPGTIALTTDGLAALGLTSSTVKSDAFPDGVPLAYSVSPDGLTLTATASDGEIEETVFIVTVDPASSSGPFTYTFTLVGSINHPDGLGENQLTIPIQFQVADSDGDTATGEIPATVVDDVPALSFDAAEGGTTVGYSIDGDSNFYGPELWQINLNPNLPFSFPVGTVDGAEGADYEGLTFGAAGRVLFAYDDSNDRIDKVDPRNGDVIATWEFAGEGDAPFNPGLTVNAEGRIFVIGEDEGVFEVLLSSPNGGTFDIALITDATTEGNLGFELTGLAADPSDPSVLYALGDDGEGTAKLVKITIGADPAPTTVEILPGTISFANDFGDGQHGLAFAPDGTLWGVVEEDTSFLDGAEGAARSVAFQIDKLTGDSIDDTLIELPRGQGGFESLAIGENPASNLRIWESDVDQNDPCDVRFQDAIYQNGFSDGYLNGGVASASTFALVVFGADGAETIVDLSQLEQIDVANASSIKGPIKLTLSGISELDETGLLAEGGDQTVSATDAATGAVATGLTSGGRTVFVERPLIESGPNAGQPDPTKIVGFVEVPVEAPQFMYVVEDQSDSILKISLDGSDVSVLVSEAEIIDALPVPTGETAFISLDEKGVAVDGGGNVFFTVNGGFQIEGGLDEHFVLVKPADGGPLRVVASTQSFLADTGVTPVSSEPLDPEDLVLRTEPDGTVTLFLLNDAEEPGEDGVVQILDALGTPVVSVLVSETDIEAADDVTAFNADTGLGISPDGNTLYVLSEDTSEFVDGTLTAIDIPGVIKIDLTTLDTSTTPPTGISRLTSTNPADAPFFDLDKFMVVAPNGDLIVAEEGGFNTVAGLGVPVNTDVDDLLYRIDKDTGEVSVFLTTQQIADAAGIDPSDVDLDGGFRFDTAGNFYLAHDGSSSTVGENILFWPVDSLAAGTIKADEGSILVPESAITAVTGDTDVDFDGGLAIHQSEETTFEKVTVFEAEVNLFDFFGPVDFAGFQFKLLQPIDHPDNDDLTTGEVNESQYKVDSGTVFGGDLDQIRFDFAVTVMDDDGDPASAPVTVTVDDDGPQVCDPQTAFVDEDDLTSPPAGHDGNSDVADGDAPDPQPFDDGDETTFKGVLNVDFGADGPGDIDFAGLDGLAVTAISVGDLGIANPLTSRGEQVFFKWDGETHTLSGVVPGAAPQAVPFIYVVNTDNDGTGQGINAIIKLGLDGSEPTVAVTEAEIANATGLLQSEVFLDKSGVKVDAAGNIFFTTDDPVDAGLPEFVLVKLAATGEVKIIAQSSDESGDLLRNFDPEDLALADDGTLYVLEALGDRVIKIANPLDDAMREITELAVKDDIQAAITDKLEAEGEVINTFFDLELEQGIAVSSDGQTLYLPVSDINVSTTTSNFILDNALNAVISVDAATGAITVLTSLTTDNPFGALDRFITVAPNGDIIVADDELQILHRVDPVTGEVTTFLTSDQIRAANNGDDFDLDSGFGFDADGNFYLAQEGPVDSILKFPNLVTINFDDVSTGALAADAFPEATFTSVGGTASVISGAENNGGSAPNFLATGFTSTGLIVDFSRPINDLQFTIAAAQSPAGVVVAQVDVFDESGLLGTVDVEGNGDNAIPNRVDLSAFENVTRIEVRDINDVGGVGYDDFSFTDPLSGKIDADGGMLIADRPGLISDTGLPDVDFNGGLTIGDMIMPGSGDGFVVTWTQRTGEVFEEFEFDVFGQILDLNGLPVGPEFQVNATGPSRQAESDAATLAGGRIVVAWEGAGTGDDAGIFAQVFSPTGQPLGGEIMVNTTVADDLLDPIVTALAGGGFVVTWQDSATSAQRDVVARVFDSDGNPTSAEIPVSAPGAGGTSEVEVTALAGGGFVVTWRDTTSTPSLDFDSLARVIGADGTPVSGVFPVSASTANLETQPDVTALTGGGFVATWQSFASGSFNTDVFARVFGADGAAVTGDIQLSTATDGQDGAHVAALPDGGFAVSWNDDDDSTDEIRVQFFDADGTARTGVITAQTTAGGQFFSDIVALANGNVLVTWLGNGVGDDDGIFGRIFQPDGTPVTGEFRINGEAAGSLIETRLDIVALPDGGFAASWEGPSPDGGIVGRVFDASGNALTGDFPVNTTTEGFQFSPSGAAPVRLADDGAGQGFLVTWDGPDGNADGIFGQLYDVDGTPVGEEFRINADADGNQQQPSATALADGGFLVTWQAGDGDGLGVFGRLFNADGTQRTGDFAVNQTTTGAQQNVSAAALDDGGFLVAWFGDGGDGRGIYARPFDSDGNALNGEFRVNTTDSGAIRTLSAAGLEGGGFAIAWDGNGAGDTNGVAVRVFDADGTPRTGEVLASANALGVQDTPSVTALSDGGFLVAWEGPDVAGLSQGIVAQRFDAAGNKVLRNGDPLPTGVTDDEFVVNSTTAGTQSQASTAGLEGGGFVVAWQSPDGAPDATDGIFARIFDADGTALGDEFLVNDTEIGSQVRPSVTGLPDGGFLVTWQGNGDGDASGVFGQRFDAAGNRVGDTEFLVNSVTDGGQGFPSATAPVGVADEPVGAERTIFELQVTDVAKGQYTFTLLDSVDHPIASTEDNLLLDLEFRVTDNDGDTTTGTLIVDIDDDSPAQNDEMVMGVVEEEQNPVPGGNEDTTAIPDLDEDTEEPDDFNVTTNVASGSLVALVDFGADGPGGFSLSPDTSLLPTLASHGETVLYDVTGNVLTGYVDSGLDGAEGALPGALDETDRTVFTLELQSDGDYTFTLLDQLDHPVASVEDIFEIDFSSVVVAEDFDHDTITLDQGSFTIKVIDDVPVAPSVTLTHDETPGVDHPDDIPVPDVADLPPPLQDLVALLESAGVEIPSVLGAAKKTFAFAYGTDGPGDISLDPIDEIAFPLGQPSGLFDTATGDEIRLASATVLDTEVVLGFLPAPTGSLVITPVFVAVLVESGTPSGSNNASQADLWFVQFRAIEHDNPNDPDEAGPEGGDFADEAFTLAYSVTDFDGDRTPGAATITIEDDGPRILAGAEDLRLVHDESPGTQTGGLALVIGGSVLEDNNDDDVPPAAVEPQVVAAEAAAAALQGLALPIELSALGGVQKTLMEGVEFDAGADGLKEIRFDLGPIATGDSTGLFTSADDAAVDYVVINDGLILGVTGLGEDAAGRTTIDKVVFSLHLQTTSTAPGAGAALFTFVQYEAVEHPLAGELRQFDVPQSLTPSHDEGLANAVDNRLKIGFVVEDNDGDTVTATGDARIVVDIEDDGPVATSVTLTHDETPGVDNLVADDVPPATLTPEAVDAVKGVFGLGALDPLPPALGQALTAIPIAYGADGPGGIALDPIDVTAFPTGQPSGLFDTATDNEVLLFNGGANTIVGRVGADDGEVAFVVFLGDPSPPAGPSNAAAADLWFVQFRAIEHDNPNDPDEANPEPLGFADEAFAVTYTVTDSDGDTSKGTATITIEDDGPSANAVLVTHDETPGVDNLLADDVLPSVTSAGLDAALAAVFAGEPPAELGRALRSFGFDYGADGPGMIELDDVINGTDSGLVDTATGGPIFLYNGPDNTVVGVVFLEDVPDPKDINLGEALEQFESAVASVAFLEETGTPSGPNNDSSADAWFVQYRAIEHDNPFDPDEANPEPILPIAFADERLGLTYTVTDREGDSVTRALNVTVEDDGPSARRDGFTVDEDGLDGGNPGGPGDVAGEVTVSVHGLFGPGDGFGVDGVGDIDFASLHGTPATALSGIIPLPLTSRGDQVFYDWNGATHTLTGFVDVNDSLLVNPLDVGVLDADDRDVFTLQVTNLEAGIVTFTLLDVVDHPLFDDPSTLLTVETAFEDDLRLNLPFTVTDGDGDGFAQLLDVVIDDDSPIARDDFDTATFGAGSTDGNVITGVDANDPNGSPDPSEADDAGADGVGVIRSVTHDGVVYTFFESLPMLGTPGIIATHEATGLPVVGSTHAFDPATGVLTIDTAAGGELAIDLTGANVGDYTYTPPASSTGLTFPFDEEFVYVLEDGDGDRDPATLTVTVESGEDNQPTATPATVTHDETPGDDGDDDIDPLNKSPALTTALLAVFGVASVADLPAELGVAAKQFGFSYGADGRGATGGLALDAVTDGTDSGLDDTETGQDILLVNGSSGTVLGRVGAADGDIAFVAFIEQVGPDGDPDARFSFVQYRAVEHDNPFDPDEANPEPLGFLDEFVGVSYTVTDANGSTDSALVTVTVEDDGPSIGDVTMINDETPGVDADSDDTADAPPLPDEIVALALTPINVSTKAIPFDYGADGPGGIALDEVTDGTDSGLFDTATGDDILLFNGPDGTVVGRVGNANGAIAFVAILQETGVPTGPDNASSADLWFVQYRAIAHDNPFDSDEANPEPSQLVTDTITFEGLAAGTIVGEVVSDRGFGPITVTGTNPDLPASPNEAIIFDSSFATPGQNQNVDRDLGTPNEDFTGPGIGNGGERGSTAPNNAPLGNLLIVADNLTDNNGDGRVDVPNDSSEPGTSLTFDFSAIGPVTMESITVVDLEANEGTTINLYDSLDPAALPIASIVADPTGDNGVAEVSLGGTQGVVRMDVLLNGSGAVDNVVFTHEVDFADEFLALGYTVTDADGDTATGTATITIEDDGPDAVNDPAVYLSAGDPQTGGDVVTNDDFGADGPAADGAVRSFSYTGDDGSSAPATLTAPIGSTVTTFAGGELTVNADGSFTYTAPTAVPADTLVALGLDAGAAGFVDDFTYVIQDGDGDRDAAVQPIRVLLNPDATAAFDGGANILTGTEASDFLRGGDGNDIINGGDGGDLLFGDDEDLLSADGDALFGGEGNDLLFGDAGNDVLNGGPGADRMTGGEDGDLFVLAEGDGGATLALADVITDFEDGTDAIGLEGGLSFADLTIGDDGAGNATIQVTDTTEFLAVVLDVNPTDLTNDDFTSVPVV